MTLFSQVKQVGKAQIFEDVWINLYHVSSVEPTPENNVTLISLTNGRVFYVAGDYTKIASSISRPNFNK